MTRMSPILLLMTIFGMILTGCMPAGSVPNASPAAPTTAGEGTLVRAITSEPAQIDPQGAASSGLSLVIPYIFDTLVVRDRENRLLPGLADRWEASPDGKVITMTLRSGVTFHDGSAMDAEAVRYTFERFKKTGTKSPIYAGIQLISGIEAVGKQDVRFSFKEPAANFWSTISMPYAGIISPESARKADASGQGHLAGTGPFTLGEWQAGQSLTLLRNAAYNWGPALTENRGAPHIAKMVYKVIPDATTQLAALEAGEVDAIFINQPEHRLRLQKNPGIRLEEAVLNSLVYLGFNTKKAPFDDSRVRQALSHAVNKAEIVSLALGGIGVAAFAPLPPTLPGFDAALKQNEIGYDPARARALLCEAGFSETSGGLMQRDGRPLSALLLTSNRAPNDAIAALLQSQFKAIGVKAEIRQLDSKAVMQASSEGAFDLLLWRYDWNDADALQVFLGSENIGSTNRVAYGNPEVDRLLARGARDLNDTTRQRAYVEAQQLILADAPWQPLYVPTDVLAISTKVQGARIGYMGRLLVNDVRVSAR